MIKQNADKRLRTSFMLLLSSLTLALMAAASGCKLFSNDASHDIAPGTEKAYDLSLPAGTLSREILSSKNFPSMLVEIQAVQGYSPSRETIDQLKAFLVRYANKPRGIEIILDAPIAQPGHTRGGDGYSLNDIKRIEARNRRHYTTKGKLALYALFLDGNLAGDIPTDRILGRAYRSQSVAIFMSSIKDAAKSSAHPQYAETTTLLHEFGHLMGIVSMDDNPRPHADLIHHTCMNPKCLMNHAAESGAQIAGFTADQIPALDQDCENDLKALKN